MALDAVGSVLGSTQTTGATSALKQDDLIKLFLTELNYQDPMEPIDNREFLAQIAQFSSLEQARNLTSSVDDLLFVNSSNQVFSLLGRTVTIQTESGVVVGKVASATYTNEGPLMSITSGEDNVQYADVRMSQIIRVQ